MRKNIVVNNNTTSIQVAFGLAVRSQREREGISQEDLADRCGLHRTYIGSVERGERNVSLKNIYLLAAALKLSPSELMRMADEKKPRSKKAK